jgi:hypothetical protein
MAPDDVLRMTSPGSRRTTFTTKKAEERGRLESEDRKAKLEIRAIRRAEAGSRFHKELEKSDGAVTVGDFLLRKLAAQENPQQYERATYSILSCLDREFGRALGINSHLRLSSFAPENILKIRISL